MSTRITKNVVLACDPEQAFHLFTERAGEWWPVERRHTEDDASAIVMKSSGRFFERAGDGTEVDLGVVLCFEPATRLVLDWYPGTGRERPTRVEIRFEAVERGTSVTVTHEAGRAGSDLFANNAAGYDRSWDLVFSALRSHVPFEANPA